MIVVVGICVALATLVLVTVLTVLCDWPDLSETKARCEPEDFDG